MSHLRSKRLIVLKGVLFLLILLGSAGLLLDAAPRWQTLLLVALVAWSSARFYYFLFYVLERYVDPTLRYAGLYELVRQLLRTRGRGRAGHVAPRPPPSR